MYESRIGSKGELFLPKEIRDTLGLAPRRKVVYRVERNRLIVEPVPTIEDALRKGASVEISLKDFYEFRKSLSKSAEI